MRRKRSDLGIGGQRDRALDGIFQLADVAWPIVMGEERHGLGRHRFRRALQLGAVFLDEMAGENLQVVLPGAERGEDDRDDLEAIV
jgi:hypothetical protein